MINKILDNIVPYKHVRFIQAPSDKDYAVYFSDIDYGGADNLVALESVNLRIELYTIKSDSPKISDLTKRLVELDMDHTKYETVWLNDEQRYMTTFTIYKYKKMEEY